MRHLVSLAVLALGWVGCPGPGAPDGSAPDAGVDSGAPGDAGPGVDAGQGLDGGTDAGSDAGLTSLVRVHWLAPDAGAHALSLRGSGAPLTWASGAPMQAVDAGLWELRLPALSGPVELKPLLDDATWAKGPNWTVRPGQTLEVYPRFYRDAGEWSRRWTSVASALLGNARAVWVYLPPTSVENQAYRAPVVYLHDGQNLFDPAWAFGGVTWRVWQTMDAAAADGSIAEAIVIGPENAGAARLDEYTPSADATYGGGRGDLYLRFLIEELKPKVDAELRTHPDREHTAILGSSLGGLISAWAGRTRSDVWGLVGAMSPSAWWDGRMIVAAVAQTPPPPDRPLRVYVDCGDTNDGLADTTDLVAAYRTAGYLDGRDLRFVVQAGASHTETYWAQRLPGALQFLLGPGR